MSERTTTSSSTSRMGALALLSDMFSSNQISQAVPCVGQIHVEGVEEVMGGSAAAFAGHGFDLLAAARQSLGAERRRARFQTMRSTPKRFTVVGVARRADACHKLRRGHRELRHHPIEERAVVLALDRPNFIDCAEIDDGCTVGGLSRR